MHVQQATYANELHVNVQHQRGENKRQGRVKTNRNTTNKIFGEHIRQFLHKNKVLPGSFPF